jgi:prenylcysteine oxidase/farnesylcysteine lyase
MRIAIIGGGAAGSGAAYRIWQRLGRLVQVTLYERNRHVGGRAWDLTFAGCHMEVGGVLHHSTGQITRELMDFTGAREGVPSLSVDGPDETYAFWTDKGFPICTKTSLVSMAAGILRHVGPASALKVTRAAIKMAEQYEGVYPLLKDHAPFRTPDELFAALNLVGPTKLTTEEYFRRLHINSRMTHDVVEAITHNMYNQGTEMNALASLVGLAGAGLAGGHLFVIEGGNWTLYDKMLAKTGAEVRVDTAVERIAATATPNAVYPYAFSVTAGGVTEEYDAVILAAPPALADLVVEKDGGPFDLVAHPYQEVQTTLVVGDLNPAYFGQDPAKQLPSTMFTARSAPAPFKSIGTTGWSPEFDSRIYKIFSADHAMTETELNQIFRTIHAVHTQVWRGAYPVLTPGIKHLPFELSPGLYFANALETIAGSMEVETVGGTNAANLAVEYLIH